MPSKSAKGLHRTLYIVVDNVPQAGSFLRVKNYEVKVDGQIVKTDQLGEETSQLDLMHHGFDVDFSIEEEDAAAAKAYERIATAAMEGRTLPRVDLVEVRSYVDGSVPPQTFTYPDGVLKLNSENASGRKELNMASFSFASRTRKRVGA